jgi:hypothetical protein
MGDRRSVYGVLEVKPQGKRLLGKPMRRREHNIKIDIQDVGSGGMDWIHLTQGRDR